MTGLPGANSALELSVSAAVARVALDRPELHNAFDETLI
jgi:hypothetical protein